jgi:hypothetical protein
VDTVHWIRGIVSTRKANLSHYVVPKVSLCTFTVVATLQHLVVRESC